MPPRLPDYDALLAISARGAWDPASFDLAPDRARWPALPESVRARFVGLVAGFVVGEEAVAEHLPPFSAASADPGLRACLDAQAVEEERHADAARRVWAALAGSGPLPGGPRDARERRGLGGAEVVVPDPAPHAPPALVALFRERLPAAAAAAGEDLTGAVALYHGLLEGVVFLAGQRAVRALAEEHGLTGVAGVFARIERDERWHVALGARVLVDAPDGATVAARLPSEARAAADAWGRLVDEGVRDAVVAAVTRRLHATGLLERPTAPVG
jgi:ribonucleoside-diphosphate reductase beta chain